MKRLSLLMGLLLSQSAAALEINDANRAQLEQLNGVGVTLYVLGMLAAALGLGGYI